MRSPIGRVLDALLPRSKAAAALESPPVVVRAEPPVRYTGIVPPVRPEMTKEEVRARLVAAGIDVESPALLGKRGFFKDEMGTAGVNDIGIYDDAIFLHTPIAFASFNANTDPSRHAADRATLEPGRYLYRLGVHGLSRPASQQYQALVQAEPVVVHRYGSERVKAGTKDHRGTCLGNGLWVGWFGINIHRGGNTTTSSEGCVTIHPTQWPSFMALLKAELVRSNAKTIPFLLLERQ